MMRGSTSGTTMKTVFVLGAGASKEANLPTGAELRREIATALDFEVEFGETKRGDSLIVNAIILQVQKTKPDDRGERYTHAARRIIAAMPQAESIDAYIDDHQGNREIEFCGKIAIVRSILAAERKSLLFVDKAKAEGLKYAPLEQTWFNGLWQVLKEGCRRPDLDARLASIAIVSFNYDRCIEHYLYHALQNYYHVDQGVAAELVSRIEILHPYGRIGSLRWQRQANAIDYGDKIGAAQLLDLSAQIKTFTESTDPAESDIVRIRRLVADARQIVFLGFAYHIQNLELLWPKSRPIHDRTYIGTAYGISSSNVAEISRQLSARSGVTAEKLQLRNDLECHDLFSEYRRSLSVH